MENIKSIGMVWLSKASLSNLNSSEGGSNFTELKTYDDGKKPYVSGQSLRHALRESLNRLHPESTTTGCTPESPCLKEDDCWTCDLFGYLNPQKGKGSERKWSPVKISPALGTLNRDIISDLLIRMSEKVKEDTGTKDQRLAHVQLVENTYKVGMVLDINAVKKDRKTRTIGLLKSIMNLSDLAKQSRNMVSFSPELYLLTVQHEYNQRIQRAFEIDQNENLNIELMETVCKDIKEQNQKNQIFCGLTPGIIKNEEEFKAKINELDIEMGMPVSMLNKVINVLEKEN